jgi:hypothetical protein
MIKEALKRRNPGFNERAFGFRSFTALLLEAEKRGLIKLTGDGKSGRYTVKLADTATAEPPARGPAEPEENSSTSEDVPF